MSAGPLPPARGSLGAPSRESWVTALKAAYFVGDGGVDTFAWAAGSKNEELRQTVAYLMYLLWRSDPVAVYRLMRDLARRVGPLPIGRTGRLLQTLSDASITIYVNHPEQDDVISETSALWSGILKGKLHLDRRRWLDVVVFGLLASVFSRRALEMALLGQRSREFLKSPVDLRARFRRVVPFVRPATSLMSELVLDDLAVLLQSSVRLHNVLAALVLAVHGIGDFEANRACIEELFSRVDGRGRKWVLQSFAVLLPETPRAWGEFLEFLTREFIEKNRKQFLTGDRAGGRDFDMPLLALGLAYAKRGEEMCYFDELLGVSIGEDDWELVCELVAELGPVGFYYPEAVFRTLRPRLRDLLENGGARRALVTTLATMRAIRLDAVDIFLRENEADLEFRQAVASETELALVRKLASWVGFYNNAVHQALHYPMMREQLLLGGLSSLARARFSQEFVWGYTWPVLRLLRKADYELIRWTEADGVEPLHGGEQERPLPSA